MDAVSWYRRRQQPNIALPSAWRYGAPTSDNSSGSTSLTAAATPELPENNSAALTRRLKRGDKQRERAAQALAQEAWDLYNQVGELRYVSNAIAGRIGQVTLYLEKDGERVEDSEDDPILALITPQIIERAALNLFIAGDCRLAGLPTDEGTAGGLSNVEWTILSSLEYQPPRNKGDVEIREVKYKQDEIYVTRIWDPHPARWEDADSPVLSSLPILRELVGLQQHVSAQIDSRLAGAGVYWIPNTILTSAKVPEADANSQTFAQNPVLNAIMTAMLLPMEDRSNASSVVPLLMGAPDDAISKIRFDSFSTPFDKNTEALREESIRRLGLALDAPPELLQGMGDANHWGMWLVRDEVVQTHVQPRADLIADAVTTGFWRPIKKQQSPDEDVNAYVVKADVSHLVQRPNRLSDASQLHDKNLISDKAYREAGGYEDEDAPSSTERAIKVALQVATNNPQLLDNIPEIVDAVKAALDGTPSTGPDTVQSRRRPGSLRPLNPNAENPGVPQASAPAGNGQNGSGPLQEADTTPAGGPPV